MGTLHLVNAPPERSDALASCLATVAPGDALLLIEDGVHGALGPHLDARPADLALYVLGPDVEARGLEERIDAGTNRIDYAAFVALCTAHDRVVTWI
jgi:tRNA 2-thiouridine synthesizing protein B